MTNVKDLHHFRVQTPSFLITDGDGEMTNLQFHRSLVDQLTREASIQRIQVSHAIEDLKKFVLDKESEDYLLTGFPAQKSNPFREKSPCVVI